MSDGRDGQHDVVLVDATRAEAEEMLGRTRARGLAALTASGTTPGEGRALIHEQHAKLLPQGLDTPGHRFVWILSTAGDRFGECWFGPLFGSDTDWYVFDIELDETHRGRGLGPAAMAAVAVVCRTMGASRLGLTVAIDNARAIAAYRAAGFATTRQDATSGEMWLDLSDLQ